MIPPEKLLKVKSSNIKVTVPGFRGELYPFQQTGVAYLYVAERANLFDICFTGESPILTEERGMLSSERVRLGDRLGKGFVERIVTREAAEFVRVRAEGFPPFEVTAGHPFLVEQKQSWGCGRLRGYADGSLIDASGIKRGDRLLIPLEFGFSVPTEFLCAPMVALAARYLADGNIEHRSNSCLGNTQGIPRAIVLTFGKRTEKDIPRFKEYVSAMGLSCSVGPARNSLRIHICNTELAMLFSQTFGERCDGKELPGWLLSLSAELTELFLKEYSDGGNHTDSGYAGHSWSSCRKENIIMLALMNLRLRRKGGVLSKAVGGRVGSYSGSKLDIWRYWISDKGRGRVRFDDEYAHVVVSEVVPFIKKQKVYNFTTSSGLIHNPFVTHNCGSGKTIQALALLQLLKNRGELGKALVLAEPKAVWQWAGAVKEFTNLEVAVAGEGKVQRVSTYGSLYDVLITSYQLLLRDEGYLRDIRFDIVIFDEAAYFRNPTTKTKKAVMRLVRSIPRRINMTATPIQNNLVDMHTLFCVLGLEHVLGNEYQFRNRYQKEIIISGVGRNGRRFQRPKVVGYKNVPEFMQKIAPYYLRRTLKDIEQYLPPLTVVNKWVDLHADQRARYATDSRGYRDTASNMSNAKIKASLHRLQMIADTLYAVGGADVSTKLDLMMEMLTGDLADQKVIIFARYLKVVEAIAKRLEQAKIGYVQITGLQSSTQKEENRLQFWNDPKISVCLGTEALGDSLNLQNSAYILALNQFYNPKRVEQLVGRMRRLGSPHAVVVFVNIMARGTLEEKIPELLKKKEAVPDFVFGEKSDIFPALSRAELLSLLT